MSKLKVGGLGELDEGEQLLDVVVVLPEPPPHVGLEEGQGEPGPGGQMALDVRLPGAVQVVYVQHADALELTSVKRVGYLRIFNSSQLDNQILK